MVRIGRTAAFAVGLLTGAAATAHAQNYYYPRTAYQAYPSYSYNYRYAYPGYGYYYSGWPTYDYYPTYGYYMGQPYPKPLAYWDPYVWYRPYSDNAGPKASGHGD
jgi:hypothetical protein